MFSLMKHKNTLSAKVAAINRANAEVKRLFPILNAAFAPFIGQKVVSKSGDVLKTVSKAMPALPNMPGLQVWLKTGNTGVYVNVKTWESSPCVSVMGNPMAGEVASYHETGFYLCGIDVQDWQTARAISQDWVKELRTDWSAEEVTKLRSDYERAERAASEAKSALHHFGTHDR